MNGSLAVSRALGDYEYKANSERGPCEQLVSPEPEVTALEKSDNDEFAVLACDGVWDVMTNEEVYYAYIYIVVHNSCVDVRLDFEVGTFIFDIARQLSQAGISNYYYYY